MRSVVELPIGVAVCIRRDGALEQKGARKAVPLTVEKFAKIDVAVCIRRAGALEQRSVRKAVPLTVEKFAPIGAAVCIRRAGALEQRGADEVESLQFSSIPPPPDLSAPFSLIKLRTAKGNQVFM